MTRSSSTAPGMFRHQRLAVERWLAQPALGLALQPGLGKSRIVLEGISLLFEAGRWLVVAPKRVATTVWPAENERWGLRLPMRVLTAQDFDLHAPRSLQEPPGAPQGRQLDFRDLKATRAHLRALIASHRVIVVTWDWVFWLAAALGERPHFDGLVLDEGWYAKTKGTKRFQAARRLAAGAGYKTVLNGTPVTNGWEDVWSQSYLLDGGTQFGRTLGDFRQQFLRPVAGPGGRVMKWADPSKSQELELRARFPRLWMAMRAEDWVTLPELMPVNDILVELEPEHWKLATQLMRAALADLPDGAQMLPPSVAAGLNKAIQVCQGRVYGDSGGVVDVHRNKADALAELVDSLEGGVLLFYQFRHDVDSLKAALGTRVAFIDERDAVHAWEAGKKKVLAAHPASMAVGLNLQTAGNNIVWFGATWDLFLWEQGIKRVHRLGNEHPAVFVHRILTRHPVEQRQVDALDGKLGILEAVMKLKEIVE